MLTGDLNNIAQKCVAFSYVYGPINGPINTSNGYLRVTKHDNLACLQEFFPYATGRYFIRQRMDTGEWTDWFEKL